MFEDQCKIASRWLFYFATPAGKYATRSCSEYARRVSVWAGEYVSPEAFIEAANRHNYSGIWRGRNYFIKARITP